MGIVIAFDTGHSASLIFLTIFAWDLLVEVHTQVATTTPKPDPLDSYIDDWTGQLKHGDLCTDPLEIYKLQMNDKISKEDKMKEIGQKSCDFTRFLYCFVYSNRSQNNEILGNCSCHESTGGPKFGVINSDGKCHIPANKGFLSYCGRLKISRQLYTGKTLEATCTENSECITDDRHAGFRCYCKIGYIPVGGYCNSSWCIFKVHSGGRLVLLLLVYIRLYLIS